VGQSAREDNCRTVFACPAFLWLCLFFDSLEAAFAFLLSHFSILCNTQMSPFMRRQKTRQIIVEPAVKCIKLATWRTFINLLGQCVCQQPSSMLHVSHYATVSRCDTRALTVEEEHARRRMTSYMVVLINRMVNHGVLCLESSKTTEHDPRVVEWRSRTARLGAQVAPLQKPAGVHAPLTRHADDDCHVCLGSRKV
jgi:hypothetical protein